MTPTKHLDFHGLHVQFWNCHIGIVELSLTQPQLKEVRIRTDKGDHYLAAIWREGDVIYFDVGQPCEK